MSISTTIDSTLGVVSTIDAAGSTTAGTITVGGLKTQVVALSTAGTISLSQAGVITISGSGGSGSPLTFVMPTAASCPGSMFVVRSISNHAHVLTGSQEANGTRVFAALASGSNTARGSALTFPVAAPFGSATVGNASVALVSDGANFLVIGASGSIAGLLSGT